MKNGSTACVQDVWYQLVVW